MLKNLNELPPLRYWIPILCSFFFTIKLPLNFVFLWSGFRFYIFLIGSLHLQTAAATKINTKAPKNSKHIAALENWPIDRFNMYVDKTRHLDHKSNTNQSPVNQFLLLLFLVNFFLYAFRFSMPLINMKMRVLINMTLIHHKFAPSPDPKIIFSPFYGLCAIRCQRNRLHILIWIHLNYYIWSRWE